MPKLVVNLVTWNGEKYLPFLFASLKKQNYSDWELQILDNNSQDKTVEIITQQIKDFPVKVKFIKLTENLGFVGGHNKLYKDLKQRTEQSQYFLLLNQDMYLKSNLFEVLVTELDNNSDLAAISPVLLRWNFTQLKTEDDLSASFSNIVDALGLKMFSNWRVIEQKTGQNWTELLTTDFKDKTYLDVFGVSGALPMYRLSAVEKVELKPDQLFDDLYHSYKEDVDLAYRLCLYGYKARIVFKTQAYHDRSAAGTKKQTDLEILKNKFKQNSYIKYYSYRNHLYNLFKIYQFKYFKKNLLKIIWFELKKALYYLLTKPNLFFKAWLMVIKNWSDLRIKHRKIKSITKKPENLLKFID